MDQNEVSHYDYELPADLIAERPSKQRTDARLLVVRRCDRSIMHRHVRDLPSLLGANDVLVLNDTRVIPARLVGERASTGGAWEGLLLEWQEGALWRILARTRGRPQVGEKITLHDRRGQPDLQLELVARHGEGAWVVRPLSSEGCLEILDRIGRVPLPPYIRKGEMLPADMERYQTVYAAEPGSVAAPTAGLHFTPQLLADLEKAGVTVCRVTLHVGIGTFRPISAAHLDEHVMHGEWCRVDAKVAQTINAARQRGQRIVAVGTTTVRTLESAAAGGTVAAFNGTTDLFIRPGFRFQAVDALMTNFHLPRSSLLVLVRTFGGDELMRRAYEEAVRERYRFYSYGDAMLIL